MLNLHPLNPLYPQPSADKARENGTAPIEDPAAAPERPQQAAHGTVEAIPSIKVMVVGDILSRDPLPQKTQLVQRNANAFCERYCSIIGGRVQTFFPATLYK